MYVIAIVIPVSIVSTLMAVYMKRIFVRENSRALLYVNGEFRKILEPGVYWVWTFLRSATVKKYDTRIKVLQMPGQELLTLDNVGIKASVYVTYRIVDPLVLDSNAEHYESLLYSIAQIALRKVVAKKEIESLLEHREEIGKEIFETVSRELEEIGIEAKTTEIRDVMFPGELKKIFNEVIRARKEGQAALEKARGESAAMRNLANAAKMIEKNPALMSLRMMQTLSDASAVSGNTFVIGVPEDICSLKSRSMIKE